MKTFDCNPIGMDKKFISLAMNLIINVVKWAGGSSSRFPRNRLFSCF